MVKFGSLIRGGGPLQRPADRWHWLRVPACGAGVHLAGGSSSTSRGVLGDDGVEWGGEIFLGF